MKPLHLALILLILLHTFTFSSTVSGSIYNADTMQKETNVLITIEDMSGTVIHQRMYSNEYTIQIPEGKYIIRAYKYVNNTLKYYAKNRVEIIGKETALDILLVPYELYKMTPDFEIPPLEKNKGKHKDFITPIAIALIVIVAGAGYYVFVKAYEKAKMSERDEKSTDTKEIDKEDTLTMDRDLINIIAVLKENDGICLQKDIREILNFSESKMSLLIAELEANKMVKRIKRGRKNIIKLIHEPNIELPRIKR